MAPYISPICGHPSTILRLACVCHQYGHFDVGLRYRKNIWHSKLSSLPTKPHSETDELSKVLHLSFVRMWSVYEEALDQLF